MTTRRGPAKKKAKKQSPAPAKRNRREEIVAALRKCMADKGFTAATLSDIAETAGMSSSHLLYYFSGKDAILEALFAAECEREQAALQDLPKEPADAFDAIAELFLPVKKVSKNERVVLLDLAGQTVQNKALRKAQAAHDKVVKGVLASQFRKTKGSSMTAPDSAHAAYALLSGLRTSSFFDSSLSAAQANKLFRNVLNQLAGLDKKKKRK